MPDTDALPAALEGARETIDIAPYSVVIATARRLLAALDAVLKAHRNADGRCAWCRNQDGQRQKWPCGEYLAITRALTWEQLEENHA